MADKRITPEPLIYDRQGDSTVLKPQASPVNNFVRPADPVKSPMWDVATALAQVNPKLNNFIEDKFAQDAKEEARDSEAKAMVSQAKSYQEAIDKGEIQPGQSPLYQRVFNETVAKNDAITGAQAKLTQKWYAADNPIRNSQDPAEIQKWMAENTKEMLEGKSVDYIKGFTPTLNQVKQNLTQSWISENVKNIETENKNAFGTLMRSRILSMAKTHSPEQIADALANDAIPQQFAGLKRQDINTLQAQAIIDAAHATGNTNLLKIGYADRPDIKNPGKMIPGVFTIPGFTAHAQQAETAILSKAHVQESRALTAQSKADSALLTQLVGQEAINARNDPNYKTPDDVFAKIAMLPHGAVMLQQSTAASRKGQRTFDPVADAPLIQRYVEATAPNSGASAEEKQRATQDILPFMTTPAQVAGLYEKLDKKDGADSPLLHSDIYRNGISGLDRLQDAIIHKIDPEKAGLAVRSMKAQLQMFTLKYDAEHRGGIDQQDFSKEFEAYSAKLIKQMNEDLNAATVPAPGKGTPASARPGTQSAPAPAAPAAAPAPTAPAPQQQGAAPAPAAPTSVANSIPVDRLVPVNPQARGVTVFPDATTVNANGQSVRVVWSPKDNKVPDMADINLLRTNPYVAGKDGVPLWERFDQEYGIGAAKTFTHNSDTEIGLLLNRLRQPQEEKEAAAARQSVHNPIKSARDKRDLEQGLKQFNDEVNRQRATPPNTNAQ